MTTLQMVPTEQIHRHPMNPRYPVTEAKSLVASVKQSGILTPLSLMPDPNGGYLLIAGERRHFAATTLTLETVPAYVRDFTDQEAATALTVDNLEREDLTAAEEAQGFLNMQAVGFDVKAIAKRVNRKPEYVETHIKAATLAPATVAVLHRQAVTLDQALALGEFEDLPEIHSAALDAIEAGRNAQQAIIDAGHAKHALHGWDAVHTLSQERGLAVLESCPNYDDRKFAHLRDGTTDLKAHAGLDCLAITYSRYAGSDGVAYYCTNPRTHRANGDVVTTEEAKAEDSTKRRLVIGNNKRFEAMNEIRREWVAQFATRTTPPKVYLPTLVALMVRESPSEYLRSIIHGHGTNSADPVDLDTLTTPAAAMVLIRSAIAATERYMDKGMWRTANPTHAHYLTALASWGYTLTDPEAMYVDAVTNGVDPSTLDYTPAEQ